MKPLVKVVAGSNKSMCTPLLLLLSFFHLCTFCRPGLEEVTFYYDMPPCFECEFEFSRSMYLHIHYLNVYRMIISFGLTTMYVAFKTNNTTFNNGSLGSRIDEERSEMR